MPGQWKKVHLSEVRRKAQAASFTATGAFRTKRCSQLIPCVLILSVTNINTARRGYTLPTTTTTTTDGSIKRNRTAVENERNAVSSTWTTSHKTAVRQLVSCSIQLGCCNFFFVSCSRSYTGKTGDGRSSLWGKGRSGV